jgi:hypothetical protein
MINDMKSGAHSRMGCDTYISTMGGVSGTKVTDPSNSPDLPSGLSSLTVLETATLHDGEPVHVMAWGAGSGLWDEPQADRAGRKQTVSAIEIMGGGQQVQGLASEGPGGVRDVNANRVFSRTRAAEVGHG